MALVDLPLLNRTHSGFNFTPKPDSHGSYVETLGYDMTLVSAQHSLGNGDNSVEYWDTHNWLSVMPVSSPTIKPIYLPLQKSGIRWIQDFKNVKTYPC